MAVRSSRICFGEADDSLIATHRPSLCGATTGSQGRAFRAFGHSCFLPGARRMFSKFQGDAAFQVLGRREIRHHLQPGRAPAATGSQPGPPAEEEVRHRVGRHMLCIVFPRPHKKRRFANSSFREASEDFTQALDSPGAPTPRHQPGKTLGDLVIGKGTSGWRAAPTAGFRAAGP